MQLMWPGLGAGVTDHSDFFDDPFDRIFRSIPPIWRSIFAIDDEEGTREGHAIRDFHPDIKGTDHNGNKYHALEPETFWWAHATFTWEFFRARELFFPVPLSRSAKRQLYAESVTWYRRYGVSDRPVPKNLEAFERRFHEICRDELELTPAVQWVLDPRNTRARPEAVVLSDSKNPLNRMVKKVGSEFTKTLVYGAMPDVLRKRFGFTWTNADRARFMAICSALRVADPAIRRGALDAVFPEGTPHLKPGSRTEVVVAGPGPAGPRAKSAA
jgi:uncharacterized protein (DUF2236 family)